MLTGRVCGSEVGAVRGLAQNLTGEAQALQPARDLARKVSDNARFTSSLLIQAHQRINNMSCGGGLFTKSLAAAIPQATGEAKVGLLAHLEKLPSKSR